MKLHEKLHNILKYSSAEDARFLYCTAAAAAAAEAEPYSQQSEQFK